MVGGSQVLVVVAAALVVEAAARCRCRRHHHQRCRRRTANYVGVAVVIVIFLILLLLLLFAAEPTTKPLFLKRAVSLVRLRCPPLFMTQRMKKSEFSIVNKNEKFGSLK